MNNSSNSWIWAAMDFADGEAKLEKFAAKFKTQEISTEFKEAFEKAKTADLVKPKPDTATTTDKKASEVPLKGFGDKFVPKSGSWACTMCYVNNSAEATKCVSCETLKPGTEAQAPAPTPFSQMKFGMPSVASVASTTTTAFKTTTVTTTTASTGFTFSSTPSTGAPAFSGMKFGVPAATTTPASTASSFSFSTPTPVTTSASATIRFGVAAATPTSTTTPVFGVTTTPSSAAVTTSSAAFSFGGSKPAFSFALPSSSTETVVSKAPFSFSPPKLATATATPQTNGQTDVTTKVTPSTTTGVTPTSSVLPGSIFGTPKSAVETKPIFGSFSFSTPVPAAVTPEKPLEEKKQEVKPSPFAGFSFNSNPTPALAPKAPSDEKKSEDKPSPFAGFSFGGFGGVANKDAGEKKAEPGMLFSLLAQQQSSTGFTIAPNKVCFYIFNCNFVQFHATYFSCFKN